jgi:ABC-type branched-subunit amino acid transport system substrate-binding protein
MKGMRRALAIGLFVLAVATAPGAAVANDDVTSGRRIFARGDAAGEFIATFAGTNAPLQPRLRRCASCHGRDGLGTREGGVEIPPISWTALGAPRDASPGRPGRPGYDEATLERALAEGVDPAGRLLAPGMPRFQLTSAQITALFDYLRIVGTERDLDPGIAADEIRLGAVLPLSGAHAAWGQAMRSGLENALAAAGPIYGRRLRLVAADAGDDAAAALRRLAASDQVFALVATMLPAGVEAARDIDDMPVIGPLVPTAAQRSVNRFYLLAPIEDQMRVLVDEIAGETPHALRLAIIGPEGSVADAVADQATRNGAMVVLRTDADDLAAVLPPAVESAPDAVVALPGVDLAHLAAQLADRQGDWLLAGPAEAVTLHGAKDARLRLVLPVLPADPRGRDPSAAMAMPPLAIAAAAVLVEGLKRMGARASRAGLIAAIETLRDFPTGVLPPLSFGRGQHNGNHASVVIRPDRKYGMTVLEGWRAPR